MNPVQEKEITAHQFVIIQGSVHENLFEKLIRKNECPPNYGEKESNQQIRSDWVSAETGFTVGRSTSGKLKSIRYLEAAEIKPFSGFTLHKEAETESYTAVFKNTLQVPVNNLEIVAHYESHSFGKPMPHYITRKFPLVKPGQRATYVMPVMHESADSQPGKKKKFRFHSVEARSSSQGLNIHLELFKPAR